LHQEVSSQTSGRLSPWRALVQVLIDPVRTFAELAEKPPVLAPYLVLMLLSLLGFWLMLDQQLALTISQAQKGGTPPEALKTIEVTSKVAGVVLSLLGPWLMGALMAVVVMAVGRLGLGEPVPFGHYFGMLGYASLPNSLGAVLQALVASRAADPAQALTVSLSLAAFLPDGANPFLRAFLGTLAPFGLWSLALLGVGFAALHKTRINRSTGVVAVVYLLTLGFAMLQAVFSPIK
jgi:hypothetical protein